MSNPLSKKDVKEIINDPVCSLILSYLVLKTKNKRTSPFKINSFLDVSSNFFNSQADTVEENIGAALSLLWKHEIIEIGLSEMNQVTIEFFDKSFDIICPSVDSMNRLFTELFKEHQDLVDCLPEDLKNFSLEPEEAIIEDINTISNEACLYFYRQLEKHCHISFKASWLKKKNYQRSHELKTMKGLIQTFEVNLSTIKQSVDYFFNHHFWKDKILNIYALEKRFPSYLAENKIANTTQTNSKFNSILKQRGIK